MSVALYAVGWPGTNVAASLSDQPLSMANGAALIAIPFDGDIVGLSVHASTPRTGGTLTVTLSLNGVEIASPTVVLDATNTLKHHSAIPHNTRRVTAGDDLGVLVTTDAGWLPITAEINVLVFITAGHHAVG